MSMSAFVAFGLVPSAQVAAVVAAVVLRSRGRSSADRRRALCLLAIALPIASYAVALLHSMLARSQLVMAAMPPGPLRLLRPEVADDVLWIGALNAFTGTWVAGLALLGILATGVGASEPERLRQRSDATKTL